MSDLQKMIMAFLTGATLVILIGFISPIKNKETRIVIADKEKVVNTFDEPTINIEEFIRKAKAREMRIDKFIGIVEKAKIDYEITHDDGDGYVWYEIYSDRGTYHIGVAPDKRIFSYRKD